MQKVKQLIQSPWMLILLMLTKLITYYSLIDVSLGRNILVLGSIVVLLLLFFEFGTCEFRYRNLLFLVLYSGFTILMFSDTMYFNYYHQTVSVKQLWQASNVAKVPKSFIATLIPASFILVIEVPLVFLLFRKYASTWAKQLRIDRRVLRRVRVVTICIIAFCAINPLSLKFVKKINTVEFFTNHVNDVFYSLVDDISAETVDSEDVISQVQEMTEKPSTQKY